MSEAELTAMDHVVSTGGDGAPGLCASFEILDADGQLIGHADLTHERGVERISAGENARTPEGVGVGSTLTEVQSAYPELTHLGPPEDSNEFWTPVPSNDKYAYWINFSSSSDGSDRPVTGFVLELQDQQCTG